MNKISNCRRIKKTKNREQKVKYDRNIKEHKNYCLKTWISEEFLKLESKKLQEKEYYLTKIQELKNISLMECTSRAHFSKKKLAILEIENLENKIFEIEEEKYKKEFEHITNKYIKEYDSYPKDDPNYNDIRIKIYRECYIEWGGFAPPIDITQHNVCDTCKEPLLFSTNNAVLVCKSCRFRISYIDTTTACMAYGEEMEFPTFAYKKSHHFEDWLKNFQIKGPKVVEPEIIRAVCRWLYNEGYELWMITIDSVKLALKNLNLRKYYDHKIQIYCKITNSPAPYMTPQQEDRCRMMFLAIQIPFIKHKAIVDPKRKNFLSYSYVLSKFCELLGWVQYLPYFSLLKGKDKLKKQDDIWKGICEEMDWTYIPSRRDGYKMMMPHHYNMLSRNLKDEEEEILTTQDNNMIPSSSISNMIENDILNTTTICL